MNERVLIMKNRKKLLLVTILFGIVLMCIFLLVGMPLVLPPVQHALYEYRIRAVDPQRHLLFCEQLTPGISMESVEEIISQYGTYRISDCFHDVDYGKSAYCIVFNDPNVLEKFGGGFTITFNGGKYEGAKVLYRSEGASSPSLIDYECNE